MKMWKKSLRLLVVCCLVLALIPGSLWAATGSLPFRDVGKNVWYRGAVEYVYERDMMVGTSSTNFSPDSSLTRAMFVTILGRMAEVDVDAYPGRSYTDVKIGQWYSPYVEWAAENGITDGYGDGRFGTEDFVTREQMATMVARYVDYTWVVIPEDENAVSAFVDEGKVSDWAEDSVDFMRRTGLLAGDTNGYFRPGATASRAEAATFFMRLHKTFDLLDGYVPTKDSVKYDETEHVYYADNILLIIFDISSTESQRNKVIESVNGTVVGIVPELDFYQVKLPKDFSLAELASVGQQLMDRFSYVDYATYDSGTPFAEQSMNNPNDPWNGDVDFSDWTDDSVDGSNWWLEAIDAYAAWDTYGDDFGYVCVGICDSSFDIEHEDLTNQYIFPNSITESRNQRVLTSDDMSNEAHYHGTHVAGIIGAEADNGRGIAGVAGWNSILLFAPIYEQDIDAEFMSWDSSVYGNLATLVSNEAQVVNFSLGKTNYLSDENPAFSNVFIAREGHIAAICMARLLDLNYDFVVVQAAGNAGVDAIQNGWFASITDRSITASDSISVDDVLDRVIIVGAAEQDGSDYRGASFSNFGQQVDIYAPGCDIYSSVPGNVLNDDYRGEYEACYGTSMAAPMVSGVCSLVWAVNSELSAAEVKEIVCGNPGHEVLPPDSAEWESPAYLVNAENAVAVAHDKQFEDIAGTYEGYYYAQQGKSGVTLTVNPDGSGVFEFYNLPGYTNVDDGSFSINVEYEGLGFYYFWADEWIEEPRTGTYNTVDLYGFLEGDTIYGKVLIDGVGGSYRFNVSRIED